MAHDCTIAGTVYAVFSGITFALLDVILLIFFQVCCIVCTSGLCKLSACALPFGFCLHVPLLWLGFQMSLGAPRNGGGVGGTGAAGGQVSVFSHAVCHGPGETEAIF